MGKIIVITGGTSGIGLSLKTLFEQKGDTVLTISLDEINDKNHYCGSVSHEIKVKQIFNDIHERFGKIDMLINCAGIGMSGITEIIPTEQIQRLTEVNYYGTLYCIRSALPYMEKGARIVNLSSAMALFPVPFRSIYGSVKSAVLNLSMSLRMELAPLGIDVVAFCPGNTKTNFTKNRIKDFETTPRYGDRLKTATEKSDNNEDKRMSGKYVAGKIFKFINRKKTKPFYIIGGKYKFLYFLTNITPKSVLLKFTAKFMGGKMSESENKKTKKNISQKANPETTDSIYSQDLKQNVEQVQSADIKVTSENLSHESGSIESSNSNMNGDTNGAEATEQKPATHNLDALLSKIKIVNNPNDNDN